jgi:uncharacterized repeat protein (TIGR03803 family)
MNATLPFMRYFVRSLATVLVLLVGCGVAWADAYNPANNELTISSLVIGGATYSDMVVTVGGIVSGPAGKSPNGSADSYDPGTGQLAVQSVTVGSASFFNVVVTVAGLVSIGAVSGADSYSNGELSIAFVQYGGVVYEHVVVTVGGILGWQGGMPTAGSDTYNSLTNQLHIAAVQVGSAVFTNAVVSVGKLLAVGGVYGINEESIFYSFSGDGGLGYTDGSEPYGGLVQDSAGNFYGTTYQGGLNADGVAYKITPAGVESVLHTFGNGADGIVPVTSLIEGVDGNFYGVAPFGGLYGSGCVFEITPAGVESVVYSFTGAGGISGSTDGATPSAALVLGRDGDFYGVTLDGGANDAGTFYKVTPGGNETVLYSFSGGSTDGSTPRWSLILGRDGNFYGTATGGGPQGAGAIFKVTSGGVESVLYFFCATSGCSDSTNPTSLLQASDGNFYGTSGAGGAYGEGTVFKITPAGAEVVLYSFGGCSGGTCGARISSDGLGPNSLIQASDGNFYGTTDEGGAHYQEISNEGGTIFKVTSTGVETVLYSFAGGVSGSKDGVSPINLIQASDGNFYGVTEFGGAYGRGTVFKLTPVVPVQ